MTKTIDKDNEIDLQDDLTEIIRAADQRSEADAAKLAAAVLDGLRKRYRGEALYIPSVMYTRARRIRDAAIRSEYNGRNRLELCAKYNVSRARLYQIVKRTGKAGKS